MAQEGFIEVPGGRVWYRSVGGSAGDGAPLLCLHGGPGFTHYYLEPLEGLADRFTGLMNSFLDRIEAG